MRVRTPRPDGGCHQCWTSPSTNCRRGARSRMLPAASLAARATVSAMHVLELVAEAVRAARLVERGARPEPAGEGLVEQPAVEQEVDRAVGRPDLDARRGRRPSASSTAREARRRGRRRGSARPGARASSSVVGLAEQEDDLGRSPPGAARRWPAARRTGRGRRRRGRRARCRGRAPAGSVEVPLRPRNSVRSRGPGAAGGRRGRRRRRGRRTRGSRGCARAARRSPASSSVTMKRRGGAARRPEHPLGVGGHREPPRPAGAVRRASGARS